jgi:hypothetical protein
MEGTPTQGLGRYEFAPVPRRFRREERTKKFGAARGRLRVGALGPGEGGAGEGGDAVA